MFSFFSKSGLISIFVLFFFQFSLLGQVTPVSIGGSDFYTPEYIYAPNNVGVFAYQYKKVEIGFELPNQVSSQIEYYYENFDEYDYHYNNYRGLNPYDPDDVDVIATFQYETGEEYEVHGFYYKSFYYIDDNGNYISTDPVTGQGEDQIAGRLQYNYEYRPWRIRFAPPKAGDWDVSIEVTYFDRKTGSTTTLPIDFPKSRFKCSGSDSKGYLQVGEGGHYLEFSNPELSGAEKSWFGISKQESVPTECGMHYDSDYVGTRPDELFRYNSMQEWRAELREFNEKGANFYRISGLEHGFQLELTNLGNYESRQYAAWEFDQVLEMGEELDWYINFDLQHFYTTKWITGWYIPRALTESCQETNYDNEWDTKWEANPYNVNGVRSAPPHNNLNGCIVNDTEYWSDDTARRFARNKLRYMINRWGYSTSIGVWQTLNELDHLKWYEDVGPKDTIPPIDHSIYYTDETYRNNILNWNYEMAEVIKSYDLGNRPVTMNRANGYGTEEVNGSHLDQNYEEFDHPSIDMVSLHSYINDLNDHDAINQRCDDFSKPIMFDEVGFQGKAGPKVWYTEPLCNDVANRNVLWSSVFSGAYCTHTPFWKFYDNPDHYTPIRNFIEGEDFSAMRWPPIGNNLPDVYNKYDNDMSGIEISSLYLNCKGLVRQDKTRLIGWLKHITANRYNVFHNTIIEPSPPSDYSSFLQPELVFDPTDLTSPLYPYSIVYHDITPPLVVEGAKMTVYLNPGQTYKVDWYDSRTGIAIEGMEDYKIASCDGEIVFDIPTIAIERESTLGENNVDELLANSTYDYVFKITPGECGYADSEVVEDGIASRISHNQIELGENDEVYYINENHQLCVSISNENTVLNEVLNPNLPLVSETSRLLFDNGNLYYADQNNHLVKANEYNNQWSASYMYGTSIEVSPGTGFAVQNNVGPNEVNVFFINDDNEVAEYYKNSGGNWQYSISSENALAAGQYSDLSLQEGVLWYAPEIGGLSSIFVNIASNPASATGNLEFDPKIGTKIVAQDDGKVMYVDESNRLANTYSVNGTWQHFPLSYSNPTTINTSAFDVHNNEVYFINHNKDPYKYRYDYEEEVWLPESLIDCAEALSNSDVEYSNGRMYYVDENVHISNIIRYWDCPKSVAKDDIRIQPIDDERIDILAIRSSVEIFPNPSTGQFTIRYQLPTDELVAYSVMDVAGRIVQSISPIEVNAGNVNYRFNVEMLDKGLYILKIDFLNSKQTISKRILIE